MRSLRPTHEGATKSAASAVESSVTAVPHPIGRPAGDAGAAALEFPATPKAPPLASSSREAGAAAVEFALVVPVLILLVFGIIQFGITFGQVLALNNASRQGARVGAVSQNSCSTIMAEVYQGSRGAIALDYPLVVSVTRPANAQNLAFSCGAKVASDGTTSAWSGAGAGGQPCTPGLSAQALTVQASSTTSFTIPPFFFISNYRVSGNGVFQCEIG